MRNECCDLLENFYLCGIKHNCRATKWLLFLVVICLKISIFVVSNITNSLFLSKVIGCDLLENFYLCGIKHNFIFFSHNFFCVVICLKISIFVVSNTTKSNYIQKNLWLWFAWKFLSLWYQTQLDTCDVCKRICCDLLENFYLCGIKHNLAVFEHYLGEVVICLKISIFVVSNTTFTELVMVLNQLWFAWKFLSLWYQTQLTDVFHRKVAGCDLLENFYLCGIKHNGKRCLNIRNSVVICLKISIFVVSNTTPNQHLFH